MTQYYTKSGDCGITSCIGGRIKKTDPRFAAIGDMDEVNATLGVALSFIQDNTVEQIIIKQQNLLFTVGAELARTAQVRVNSTDVTDLEKTIDDLGNKVKPQMSFLLPNGTKSASFLHLARAITRRAEISLWKLHEAEPLNNELLRYVNRLSSLLFVLARYQNKDIEEQAPKY